MRREGSVEITKWDTAAKCTKCRKSIMYQLPMSSTMWKEILKAFIRRHKDCS